MTTPYVRLPEDHRRFDRVGLAGALILPALLALLWFAGLGPTAYTRCETAGTGPAELDLRSEAGKVTLAGRIGSDGDRKRLVEAGTRAYGIGNVTDRLVLDRTIGPLGWPGEPFNLLKRLKASAQPIAVRIGSGGAAIEGVANDQQSRDETVGDAVALLGGKLKLDDRLTVRPQPQAKRPEPAPQPALAPAPTPPAAALPAGMMRHRLPDGTEIVIGEGGLEANVLAFLSDASRAVDKGIWFDFDRLQFKTGSSSLTPESKAQIDTVVAILRAYPAVAVKIGGYTDNVGDPAANLRLSTVRAERVAEELAALGIAADRIEAEGYGDQHPIAGNDTAEGRAKNRRTALSVRRK